MFSYLTLLKKVHSQAKTAKIVIFSLKKSKKVVREICSPFFSCIFWGELKWQDKKSYQFRKPLFARFHNLQSVFMILNFFVWLHQLLSQAMLSGLKFEKKIMPIEKHKYDPFSDPKLACLFFLPYSQLKMCKEKCQNHAIYCRNIENYNILSEKVKI